MTAIERLDSSAMALAREIAAASAHIVLLREGSGLSDGAATALVREGSSTRVLQISPITHPDVVAEGATRAKAFAAAVGPVLAGPVVLPLDEGRADGRSFAIFPFREAFPSGRLRWWNQRRRIAPALLDWLAGIASVQRPKADAGKLYSANLVSLSRLPGIDEDIMDSAHTAIAQIDQGGAALSHIPMHGDLWRGNILSAPADAALPFTVIDWRGSQTHGYPIFDLVRLASSYRLSPARLGGELRRHGEILGCSVDQTEIHLLAALGHYARHLGEMPLPAFLAMSRACVDLHRRARRDRR